MYYRKHIGSSVHRRSGTWSTAGRTTRQLYSPYTAAAVSVDSVVGLLIRQSSDRSAWIVWFVGWLGFWGIFAFFHCLLFCCPWWVFNYLFGVALSMIFNLCSSVFFFLWSLQLFPFLIYTYSVLYFSFSFTVSCVSVFCSVIAASVQKWKPKEWLHWFSTCFQWFEQYMHMICIKLV